MAYQDDIALMAHLMRRAGFGAGRDELDGYLREMLGAVSGLRSEL